MISQELVNKFQILTPVEVLVRNKRNEISPYDLKLLEKLQESGLNDGVINVLVEFVLLVDGMKLDHGLVEKIASHWLEYGVGTIEQAIIFSRKEHRLYRTWKKNLEKRSGRKWA